MENEVEDPTLRINDGEKIVIRLRAEKNQGENVLAPDATMPVPVGALMRGVPYTMTFCGKYWLLDSYIHREVDGAWVDVTEDFLKQQKTAEEYLRCLSEGKWELRNETTSLYRAEIVQQEANGKLCIITELTDESFYDVSATPADKVKLYLLTNGDGTLTALLAGKGDTENMAKDGHPWKEYINAITAIVVGKGVTSIGERLFQRHEAVKSLVFEDSGSIKHLGRLAFQGCQMGGEYSFPNLTDTELAQVFSHCPNLEGITLNANVDSLAANALSSCLNLRYANGLNGVRTVGLGAFAYTPKLERLDFDPEKDISFLKTSFRISGAMRYANDGIWDGAEFLPDAVPVRKFTPEELEGIRQKPLPELPFFSAHSISFFPLCMSRRFDRSFWALE